MTKGAQHGTTYTRKSERHQDRLLERSHEIVASWGGGWEHVSVSLARRCPTWEEMCMIKDIFWGEEECVVEYHPPRSQYVNRHPYCLHLWKKIGEEFETPPKEYVG